ncbi:hypothetical protein [Nocardia brasiliensis]|uniref:hypothetical protein n=1 Tax=Nocardia brasiliensis TaxID=37326 RepID=UPI002456FA49|nr:hypothetical protein [Nocardia brasiliensis]
MAFRDIEGAYQGALRTFKTPMLDLLHQTYAPFVVTTLASMRAGTLELATLGHSVADPVLEVERHKYLLKQCPPTEVQDAAVVSAARNLRNSNLSASDALMRREAAQG